MLVNGERSQYNPMVKEKKIVKNNDTLLDNKSYPEKIIFKIIKEDASSYLALKNQEIDVTTNIGNC